MKLKGGAKTVVLTGLGFAVVLLGASVALFIRSSRVGVPPSTVESAGKTLQAPNASPPPSSGHPDLLEPRRVTWRLDSSPTGATLFDEADRMLGKTPLELRLPAQPGTLKLRIRRPGYVDGLLTLSTELDVIQVVELKPHPSVRPIRPSVKASVSGPTTVTVPNKYSAERRIGFED